MFLSFLKFPSGEILYVSIKTQSQDTLFDFTLASFSASDVNSPSAFRFPFEEIWKEPPKAWGALFDFTFSFFSPSDADLSSSSPLFFEEQCEWPTISISPKLQQKCIYYLLYLFMVFLSFHMGNYLWEIDMEYKNIVKQMTHMRHLAFLPFQLSGCFVSQCFSFCI